MTRRDRFLKWVYGILTASLLAAAVWQLSDYLTLRTWQGGSGTARYAVDAQEEEAARLLKPDVFTVSSGDYSGRMALVTSQTAFYNELFADSCAYLEDVFTGQTEPVPVDLKELAAFVPACRYYYACTRSSAALAEALGVSVAGSFLFREIWIIPLSEGKSGPAALFVLPGESAYLAEVSELRTVSGEALQQTVRRAAESLGENYFDSVGAFGDRFLSSFPIADRTVTSSYIPWRQLAADTSYDAAFQTASRFFAYPELVRGEEYAEGIVFTDDRVSVRISENGLIDYLQTPSQTAAPVNINRAYALAAQFLETDLDNETTVWETVLESVLPTEGGYVFTWNYKIDGVPIILEESLLKESGMTGAVQIEVRNGAVYRMRRFELVVERGMLRPRLEEETQLDVLSRYANLDVEEMERVYRLADGEAVPYWRIRTGSDVFYEKVR